MFYQTSSRLWRCNLWSTESVYLANKIESVQYNAALPITGAIRGTFKEKLYHELSFESLKDRRWLRWLCYLYKIVNTKQQACFYDPIPPFQRPSRNKGCIYEPFCRTASFKNYFLLYAIKEWNKLDSEIRNAETYASFQKMLLNFTRPIGSNTYKIYDSVGMKLLTRLRLGFSHLPEHKFRHNFHFIFFYAAKIILLYAQPLWMT